MILPVLALLLQIPAIPQNLKSTTCKAEAEIMQPSPRGTGDNTSVTTLTPERIKLNDPSLDSESGISELPAHPSTSESKAKSSDRSEKLRRREWLALSVVQHSAATFDAWSTRRVVAYGGQELNPTLRPFAGNGSIYAAIQVEPVVFDYLGRRMMTSQHGWARRTWWILQGASTVASLASGAYNLNVR
jgi:hypothetical protein